MLAGLLGAGSTVAQPDALRPGMSETQVVQLLGAPDRTAVLEGKELRDAGQVPADVRSRLRLVYVYERSGVQVWFRDGRVTGVTRDGVSPR